MILLELKKIVGYKPESYTKTDFSDIKSGQKVSYIFEGNHPVNCESGTVEFSVKVLRGEFTDISNLIFIAEDPVEGKLINRRRTIFGQTIIELDFNTLFRNGLQYSLERIIEPKALIIGLSREDSSKLDKLETQMELLSLLSSQIIPSRAETIIDFAIPSLICDFNKVNQETKSHFVGSPKHTEDDYNLKSAKFHLASLSTDEISRVTHGINLNKNLSFYLNILNTEDGWPEMKGDFKVINSDLSKLDNIESQEDLEPEKKVSFHEYLDIPRYDHSLLTYLKFSEDEKNRYEALNEVYKSILLKTLVGEDDIELTKIFGYPESIQNCVAYEAEINFNQREYGDEIFKDAVEWQLLLQVSPYYHDLEFFDAFGDGSIYYMIRKEDLIAGNFDNCQVIVQNT